MPQSSRLVIAILVAPVIGCLVGLTVWALVYTLVAGSLNAGPLILAPVLGLTYGVSIGIAAMILFGLPIHALLHRFKRARSWAYLLGGSLAGAVTPFLVILALSAGGEGDESLLTVATQSVPPGAFLGLCCAGAFWLIRRPDLDPPNPPTSRP
jgi:hypothetical protein